MRIMGSGVRDRDNATSDAASSIATLEMGYTFGKRVDLLCAKEDS